MSLGLDVNSLGQEGHIYTYSLVCMNSSTHVGTHGKR